MKKIISFLLAALLLVSAVPMVYAADVDYTQGTAVTYTATGTEAYTVTVPAQLAPGGSGTVTLSGTWPSNTTIKVTADTSVTLTNSIKADDQKVLDVTFSGIEAAGSNTESQTFTQQVSVSGIENALFGTWSGKFNYNVEGVEDIDHNGTTIPKGATYTQADGIVLNEGEAFPTTMSVGDVYTYGDYTYKIGLASGSGWDVKVIDKNQTSYGPILPTINGLPIVRMVSTFSDCKNLTIAPQIPDTVYDLMGAFYNCTSLTTAPVIPNSVTCLASTFSGCSNLKTYVGSMDADGDFSGYVIPSSVGAMSATFNNCTSLTTAPAIPSSAALDYKTFYGCTSMTGVILLHCSTYGGSSFYNCPATITYYHIDGCDGSCGK